MYFDHIYPFPQLFPASLGSGALSAVWSTTHWGFHHEGKLALVSSYSMPTAPSWGRAFRLTLPYSMLGFPLAWACTGLVWAATTMWIQMSPTLPVCRKPLWLDVIHHLWICNSLPSPGKILDSGGQGCEADFLLRGPTFQSLMLERGLRGSGWGASFSWDVAS